MTAAKPMKVVSAPIQHGVESAHYNNAVGTLPEIICFCGWSHYDDSWEDVGAAFDFHLEESAGTLEHARATGRAT